MIRPNRTQSNNAVAEHYDELDEPYRKIWGTHLHHGLWKSGKESSVEAARNLSELVATASCVEPGAHLCDIGCGYGETARLFSQQRNVNVTAFTVSKAQYEYAVALSQPTDNIRYILGDWLKNSLPSNHYQAAISIESSEHMVDKPLFFSEAYRVLQPKGKIVICAWLAKHQPNKYEVRYLLEPICREGRLPSMGSVKDYLLWLEQAGFHHIQFTDLTRQVKKTWPICAGRAAKAFFFDPHFRATLLNANLQNRVFFKTIFRIWMAYQIGSMQYGVFEAEK